MTKITKRVVEAARPGPKDYFIFDENMPGFGVRILPSGKRSYLIQYRSGGRTRRVTLGRHGTITADEARKKARKLLGAVAGGDNPAEEIHLKRRSPTVAALCERYMTEHVAQHCKPKTQVDYGRSVDMFIIPAIGAYRVSDVTRKDIAQLHHEMREKPYQANRTLAVLSKMFNLAEIWGLRHDGSNPCRHVKKYREESRERYLSPPELTRLGQALNEYRERGAEAKAATDAIRLLILTGCRLGEIQTLKWAYVAGDTLRLPDSKTGAKTVYLGNAAIEVLAAVERDPENEYVIAGKMPGHYLTDLQRPWRRIREMAGLEGVRIHDLRHSFASSAVGIGESLPMIGKLLGHKQVQTTARYAHLADDPVRASAQRISSDVARALNGGSPI